MESCLNAEIVTCCYCGSRIGVSRNEPGRLRCDSCGAPVKRPVAVSVVPVASAAFPSMRNDAPKPDNKALKKQKKKKKKKSLAHRLFDGVSDAIEDLFD